MPKARSRPRPTATPSSRPWRSPCSNSIEGINADEVATKILALQTNLQAAYQTTSMLYQTSLVKFLPIS